MLKNKQNEANAIIPIISDELWFYIFKMCKLSPAELLRLSRISKQHYQIAFDYRLWKKHLPAELSKEQHAPALYRFFALQSGSLVRRNIFNEIRKDSASLINWRNFQYNNSKKLEEILSLSAIILRNPNTLAKLNARANQKFYFSLEQWQAIIATRDVDLFNICRKKELQEFKQSLTKLFHFAAAEGALDILKIIWEECKNQQQDLFVFASEDCFAFCEAAGNGHLLIIKWLWSIANEVQQQTMLRAGQSDDQKTCNAAFYKAACNGHLAIISWLWSRATVEQQQEMLQMSNYSAFWKALANGHLLIVKWLWSIVSMEQQQAMLQVGMEWNYSPFEEVTTCYEHLSSLKWVWSVANKEQQQAMLQAGNYHWFFAAAFKGQLHIIEWLWSIANEEEQQAMFEAPGIFSWDYSEDPEVYYGPFCIAVRQGHIPVMEWLWSKATIEQQCAMLWVSELETSCRIARNVQVLEWLWSKATDEQKQYMLQSCYQRSDFFFAALTGNVDELEWLWTKSSFEQQQVMLQKYNYGVFYRAVGEGQVGTLDWIWSKLSSEQQQVILQKIKYKVIFDAACSGHVNTLDWLWSKISFEQQQVMLQKNNYEAFALAGLSGDVSTLEWIWSKVSSEQQQAMLQKYNYDLFRYAVRDRQVPTLNWLWSKASDVQQLAMLPENNYVFSSLFLFPDRCILPTSIWLWDHLPINQDLQNLPIGYQQIIKDNFSQLLEKKVMDSIPEETRQHNLKDLENTLAKLKRQGTVIFEEERCQYYINKIENLINWIKSGLFEQDDITKKEEENLTNTYLVSPKPFI